MPSPVSIGIFNIAKTVVDRDEVRRWLDFIGADEFEIPEDGAVSNPALLIALAAKRCYKSFQPGLNPNMSKVRSDYVDYFENILASGHGSVLEHSVFSFALENVSRVFTAEMNRHRAGWAISEGSMRFIRYSESIPYWEPDSIKASGAKSPALDYCNNPAAEDGIVKAYLDLAWSDDKLRDVLQMFTNPPDTLELKKGLTRAVFRAAFSSQETAYRAMELIWAEELAPTSQFKGKKEITSMMRRIVGMGVATGGVWSGNVRGLRHVLTMRASPAAEEEILHVFSRIAKQMQEQEPLLFGDFHQNEQGYWVPKYVKV